jgi:hypothetical protein
MPKIPARLTIDNKDMWHSEFYGKLPSIKESILKIGTGRNIHPRVPVSVELKLVHIGYYIDFVSDESVFSAEELEELRNHKEYDTDLIISEIVSPDTQTILPVSSIVVRLPGQFYPTIQNNNATMDERDESRSNRVSRQRSLFRLPILRLRLSPIRQE